MRAVILPSYGPPERLEVAELPDPTPGPGDVLIDVHATSVNPVDCKIRQGTQRAFIRYDLPWVLGLDVAGEVAAVGSAVTRFKVGDAVFGSVNYKRPGCYAERVAVDAGELAHKPPALSFEEAASLPLVGLTAWQSLVDAGRLSAGERVLIQAGAGGVGAFAIQLARHLGATVTTTCSAANAAFVRQLGADRVVDYRAEDVYAAVHDQDLVLDSLGGAARWQALDCLKRGGRHVSIVSDIPALVSRHGPLLGALRAVGRLAWFKLVARLRRGVRSRVVVQRPNGAQLAQIAALVDQGAIRPTVGQVLPLEQVAEAHALSETGHARGKIVLRVSR